MRKILSPVVVALAICLVVLPLGASVSAEAGMESSADDVSAEKMAVDAVLIRPFGLISTALGYVVYVVSLPFSYPGGNTQEVWETMVERPANFTFQRPLGDF